MRAPISVDVRFDGLYMISPNALTGSSYADVVEECSSASYAGWDLTSFRACELYASVVDYLIF